MLTCSNCGASVREGARFCTRCGTRLNDPVAPAASGVWGAAVSSETSSSTGEATGGESGSLRPGGTSDGEDAVSERDPDTATVSASIPDEDSDTAAETTGTSDEGFTWSWGTSSNADSGTTDTIDQVDEESGIVLEEAETTASEGEEDSGELVDATEIDIREADDTGSDDVPEEDSEPSPETSDTMLVLEDEEQDTTESETLAAWAEQWESPEADDETGADEASLEPERGEPTPRGQDDATVPSGDAEDSKDSIEDEEDTVTKAERLIGELRSLIPTLARPMPSAPAARVDAAALADELEGAARTNQFEDVREMLRSAREHPRDVDTMLNLAGNVSRLLELLDDRDNLAQIAESAATRLRATIEPTEM